MTLHRISLQHWQDLWQRLGLAGDGTEWHARLTTAYSEPQRAYHTLQHLEECLHEFDEAKLAGGMAHPDVVEMALWFHDAVYDPQGAQNEELSAAMAVEALAGHDCAAEVRRLILLTQSHQPQADAEGADDAWMIDIDLSIFGQPPERVLEYEQQIRQEYAWVPEAVYREKRREILAAFLERPRIYLTDEFHARHDRRARENLALLIRSL